MKGICLLKNLFIVWHLGFWRILRRSQILCVSNIWIHKGMLPRFLVDIHIHVARSFVFCVMLCRSLFVLLSLFFGNWLPLKWRTYLPAPSSYVRQFDFNSSFGITATTDGSYGKNNLELQPVVSEIPNDKEELEAYLRLTGLPGVRVSKPFCFCFVLFFVFC